MEETRAALHDIENTKCRRPLCYDDLYEGGLLADHVKAFTLFQTVEINDAFLEIINYTDGSEGSYPKGDGLCENLRPYSHVKRAERSGKVVPPSMDPESDEYIDKIRRAKNRRKGAFKEYPRTWKDDYLAFCIYVRSGTTQEFCAGLCGVSEGHMSDP